MLIIAVVIAIFTRREKNRNYLQGDIKNMNEGEMDTKIAIKKIKKRELELQYSNLNEIEETNKLDETYEAYENN